MDNRRKVFVKTDGRSSDQMASSADESGKKLAHESESTVIALPCEMCEELCPSDKLIDHQLQCRKERENAKHLASLASWQAVSKNCQGGMRCNNLASDAVNSHRTSSHIEWGIGTGSSIWKSSCYSTMSWGNRWDFH